MKHPRIKRNQQVVEQATKNAAQSVRGSLSRKFLNNAQWRNEVLCKRISLKTSMILY
jgi:hypothetical protein